MPSTSSSAACIFSRSSACARFGTRLVRTEKASPRSSNCSTSRRSSSRSRETHDLYVNEAQPADPDASSDPGGCCRTKSLVDERSDYLRRRGGAAGAPAACVCRRQGGRDSGVAPADSAHGFSARLHRPQSDAARTRHEDRGDRRRRLPSAVRIGTRVMPSSRLLSLSLEIA
jgi:hypothetical protein